MISVFRLFFFRSRTWRRFFFSLAILTSGCLGTALVSDSSLLNSFVVAQSVQLPTFGYTGTATTVSVPDRGSMITGSVNRSSSSYIERGTPLTPFRNRAWGHSTSANVFSTHVYVHDFEAMDEQLLGTPDPAGSGQGFVRNGSSNIPVRITSSEPSARPSRSKSPEIAVQTRSRTVSTVPQTFFLSGDSEPQRAAVSRATAQRTESARSGNPRSASPADIPATARSLDNTTLIQASKFDE